MRTLDRTSNYAEVLGVGEDGTKYIQNGLRFDIHGVALPGQESSDAEPEVAPVGAFEPVQETLLEEDLKNLHWQVLKKLVEGRGWKWTNRQAAIEALKG